MSTAVAAPRPRRVPRGWDIGLTVGLLVLDLAIAVLAGFAGLFLVFASDSCGSGSTCNSVGLSLGVAVAVFAPAVVLLIAVTVAVILLVRRRVAFWVPLAGLLLMGAAWAVGAVVVASSVRRVNG